uniref:Cullin domain-containing protein n=1 Tax=Rodentolepis nana TaxID=102285 RepID=A0A0R3U0W4_RODNA
LLQFQTDSSSQIENSFIDLENANDNIRRQALDDIENLSTGVPKEQFISIYRRLLSYFKICPTNSSFAVQLGKRIWEKLTEKGSYFNCNELLKMFLDIIGFKIERADISSLSEYLVTDFSSQIEKSFIDLENANDNIRRQALDDIENLSTGVPKEHREEIVEGCVLALLDSIISQIEKSRYAEDHYVKAQVEREAERLRVNMAFIEALLSRHRAKAGQIMSESAEYLFNDHRNRDPLLWADYLGASEWRGKVDIN